jgi:hypothetical protein
VHAKIALNIINIIVEHRLEALSESPVDASTHSTTLLEQAQNELQHIARRRWYDVNETLRSVMFLLQDTPEELQLALIPSVCTLIETTIEKPLSA